MQRVHASLMGAFVRRAVVSKSWWKRRQACLSRGGAGLVMAWREWHARCMFATEAAGRWNVISAIISAGKLKRFAAGIWRCLALCLAVLEGGEASLVWFLWRCFCRRRWVLSGTVEVQDVYFGDAG